jgi:hypothetical protein
MATPPVEKSSAAPRIRSLENVTLPMGKIIQEAR